MSDDFKIKLEAELDTSKAEKKLNDLKKNQKVGVEVNVKDSGLDDISKKTDKLKDKKVNVDTKVSGTKSVDNLSKSFDHANKSAGSFKNTLKGFTEFGAYLKIFHMIEQQAKKAITAVKSIDKEIVDLQMATGDSYQNTKNLVKGYNGLAKELGAVTGEISKGADSWLRQGRSISETNTLIRDSMVLSKVANIDSADSTKYLTSSMKGFKTEVKDVMNTVDRLVSVDMVSATDAGGLAEGLSKVSASADLVGISMDKMLGYLAATGEASQEGMTIIGNAFKGIISRMGKIKAGQLELIDEDGTVEKLSDVETVLNNVGIQLRGSDNEFRNFGVVLDETAAKWKTLSSVQKEAVSQAFAGQYQANRFKLLMQNYDKAMEYQRVAEQSAGTALEKFNNSYLNSLEAKQKTLQASFESLSTNLISREAYSGIIDVTRALVEFLDKTNAIKGVSAGLAVGGMLKGFTALTTGITKATMQMSSFGNAMSLLKNVSSVGTSDFQDLIILTDGLSKSQLKAVLSSQALSVQQRIAILTSKGLSVEEAKATLSTMGLATAQGTATATTVSMSASLKGLWATMLANPILLVGTAIMAGVSAWSSYNRAVEETVQSAKESGQAFSENNSLIQSHISKVQELRQALASGTLSEEESYNVKSQLLEIQNQLTSQYGEQAKGIDLVNGSLEKEIALMNQLAVQDANKFLNENDKGIKKSKEEMTESRKYQMGITGKVDSNIKEEIQDIAKEFEDSGIHLNGTAGGYFEINFVGDASQADTTINDFLTKVRQLKDEYESVGKDTSYLDKILADGSKALSANKEILDEYQELYNNALMAEMVSKGFGADKPAAILNEYTKAVEDYNEALASSDASKVNEAKIAFEETQDSVNGVLKRYPEYESIFDNVGEKLNETAIKANELNDSLKAEKFEKTLSKLKDLKDVDLKGISFDDNETSKSENALKSVVDEAIRLGVVTDDSSDSIATVVDLLAQMGDIGSTSTQEVVNNFSALYDSTQKTADSIIAVKDALQSQSTGKSVNLAMFNSDELKDYQSALEYVSGTMQLNQEKVIEITKAKSEEAIATNEANKAMKQSEYLKNANEIDRLREKLKTLNESQAEYGETKQKIDSLSATNERILLECDKYNLLTASIKEATSAYQTWLDRENGAESGDMFDDSLNAMQAINNIADKDSEEFGRTGTKRYQAAVDLIVPDTVDKDDDQAIQNYINSISKYFDFDKNGERVGMNITKFCQEAVKQGLMNVEVDENDKKFFNLADGVKMEDFAEKLKLSSAMVQAMFGEMEEFKGKFDWGDEVVKTVGDLGVQAYQSAEALKAIEENSDLQINLDVSNIENVDDKISSLDDTIAQMNELKAKPEVDASEIKYANDIIQYCVAQKQQLTEPVIMSVDTSQVEEQTATAISKLQEFQRAKNELDMKASIGADTTEAQKKVDNLAAEIKNNKEMVATIKANVYGEFDETSKETIAASINAITVKDLKVKANVEDSAIKGYKPEDKEATVKYDVDHRLVDAYDPDNLRRTVTYTYKTEGEKPKGEKDKTPKKKPKPKVNGTAHAKGIVKSYHFNNFSGRANASGNWGLKQDETSLVGELGQELVVDTSTGTFHTIGDNGAEFVKLKRGNIIFNHMQTKALLENGYVTGRGKLIGTNANGTAHAKGTARVTGGIGVDNANKTSVKSYSSKTKKKKSTDIKDSADKALEEIKNYFDWVAVRFERLARNTKLAEDAIKRAVGLQAKQSATDKTISQVQAEKNAAKAGANKYLSFSETVAKQLGLSSDIKKKVQDGTIDITKYDEKTQNRISEYKTHYDKYLQSLDKVTELQDKEIELAQSKLENISKFYDLVNSVHESVQSMNDAMLEFEELKGFSSVSDSVRKVYESSMSEAQSVYNNAVKQLNDYQNEFNSLVSSGYIKQGSDAWYEAQKQIAEFKQAMYEASSSIVEFEDKIRAIEYQKIQNVIDGLERSISKLDKWITLQESRDEKVDESVYQEQIDANNSKILANKELRDKKLKEQNLYDVGSKRYQELAEEINSLDESTLDLLADNEALENSIFELRFADLDDAIEKYDKLSNEISDFYDLLNEDAFFDRNGKGTSELSAGLALLSQQMAVNKQKIADYRTGLDKLQESFRNGVISEKEYNEKSEEYRDGIRDSVKANEDLKDSISDLYIEQMSKEMDALKKLNDEREKAIDRKAQYYEYDRKIKGQSRDLNMLKAQAKALEGINNAQAAAELKRLNQQIAEKEQELNDTKREHSIEMQKDGYSSLNDEMDKLLEDATYEIAHNVEKQEQIISSMLGRIVGKYADAYDKINQIIGDTGWVGSGDFNKNHSDLGSQDGASSQVDDALKKPPQFKPSDDASNVVTDPIKDNGQINSSIEDEIMQKPNTENRLCAELKLSKSSVSLMEGKSTSVAASIRPNDAKNKTLNWTSSNPKVAIASNGTIKAIAPGSCQITASTTDGSGLSKTIGVIVTKKPEPPKPKPKPPTNTGSGNGKADVGDAVTFMNGRYYYDSYSMRPTGNQMLGKTVYITRINPRGNMPYHIAKDKAGKHPLGWVRLNQIKGYKDGINSVPHEQIAEVNEEGREMIVTKDGRILRRLQPGDGVIRNEFTEKLIALAKQVPDSILKNGFNPNPGMPYIQNVNKGQKIEVNMHCDSFVTVEGNMDNDVLDKLNQYKKAWIKESCDTMADRIYREGRKAGYHR